MIRSFLSERLGRSSWFRNRPRRSGGPDQLTGSDLPRQAVRDAFDVGRLDLDAPQALGQGGEPRVDCPGPGVPLPGNEEVDGPPAPAHGEDVLDARYPPRPVLEPVEVQARGPGEGAVDEEDVTPLQVAEVRGNQVGV